jgi:hypothetical protein
MSRIIAAREYYNAIITFVFSEPGAGCWTSARKYVSPQCALLIVIMTSLGLRLLNVGAAYLARLLRDFVPVLSQI